MRERAQPQQCEERVESGERCQRCKCRGRVRERQAARRLPEQHRHIPAERQDGAPHGGERIHSEHGKSHAGIAKGRRDHDAGQPKPGREVAHQELQERTQRQIADQEQRRGNDDHCHIALEGDAEQPFQDQRHRQHDHEKDRKQRRELPGERHDRIATGAGEPGAHATTAKFGADRIAGGDRHDHMHDHRQQRSQQELGIIPLRIDQHDGFGGQRTDARRTRRSAGRRAPAGGPETVDQARRCDTGRGEELLVIEGNNRRAALGLQITFEFGRQIDGADGLARPYRARCRCQVAGALDDAEAG